MLSNIACIVFFGLLAVNAIAMREEVRAEARDEDLYDDAEGWEKVNDNGRAC